MFRPFRAPFALAGLPVLVLPALAYARSGGGEHYVPSFSGDDDSGGGDGFGFLLRILLELAFRYPKVGVPLLLVAVVGYVYIQRQTNPTTRTQKALSRREAEQRTAPDPAQPIRGTIALKAKDPDFDLMEFYRRVAELFVQVQEAWFRRDLTPVRPLLSDATFQRLTTQLELHRRLGVRDAICDVKVNQLHLVGVEENPSFDIAHVRVSAEMRDTDVPATHSNAQALEAARRTASEDFVEVWTFVRKPGIRTRADRTAAQGKCPNCGAPFSGGATNTCEYCSAVVNSGNYDWVLSEITQGVEYQPHASAAGQLGALRAQDPALSTEALEDRASLIFWRWISAYAGNEPRALAKLASPGFLQTLGAELAQVAQSGHRRVFFECAVGGVNTRQLLADVDGYDEASVELRWSARMGFVKEGQAPTSGPPLHQRSVFVLTRKAGARTHAGNGMATSRCPHCNGPLTDTLTSACDFCGAELSTGERDWVLQEALSWEAWLARDRTRRQQAGAGARLAPPPTDLLVHAHERERLLAMMAALAAADGVVDAKERKLLQLCATRWSVPWDNVEHALAHGTHGFDRLVPKGGGEAEQFLRAIVQMALVDGKVDRQERRMLEGAAAHLGVFHKLAPLLAG